MKSPFGKIILDDLMCADDPSSGPSKGSQDGRERSNETILIDRLRQRNSEDRAVCVWIDRYQVRKGSLSGCPLRYGRERFEEPHASFDEPGSSLFEFGGLSRWKLGGSRRRCCGWKALARRRPLEAADAAAAEVEQRPRTLPHRLPVRSIF